MTCLVRDAWRAKEVLQGIYNINDSDVAADWLNQLIDDLQGSDNWLDHWRHNWQYNLLHNWRLRVVGVLALVVVGRVDDFADFWDGITDCS